MTTTNDAASQLLSEEEKRPEMLKILCILSFVGCGLMLLIYSIGTMLLSLDADSIAAAWEKVLESNPQFAEMDAQQFFHEFGMICLYGLIASVFSLVGVIMMWRLEKIGFFIYAIAELSTNFFSMSPVPGQEKSNAGTVFMVLLDLVFIVLYFTQLKYMKKKTQQ